MSQNSLKGKVFVHRIVFIFALILFHMLPSFSQLHCKIGIYQDLLDLGKMLIFIVRPLYN